MVYGRVFFLYAHEMEHNLLSARQPLNICSLKSLKHTPSTYPYTHREGLKFWQDSVSCCVVVPRVSQSAVESSGFRPEQLLAPREVNSSTVPVC